MVGGHCGWTLWAGIVGGHYGWTLCVDTMGGRTVATRRAQNNMDLSAISLTLLLAAYPLNVVCMASAASTLLWWRRSSRVINPRPAACSRRAVLCRCSLKCCGEMSGDKREFCSHSVECRWCQVTVCDGVKPFHITGTVQIQVLLYGM